MAWPGGPEGTLDAVQPPAEPPQPSRGGRETGEAWGSVPTAPPDDTPRRYQENSLGYPRGLDPLFDSSPRPSWQHQPLEPANYLRPAYVRPQANDVPIYRQEPWDKPTFERPAYLKPFADDKPRYTIENELAPGYVKPSDVAPSYTERPNYFIRPYVKPADHAPSYEIPIRDAPEYHRPVYQPQEYQPPRELPPPYMAPAK